MNKTISITFTFTYSVIFLTCVSVVFFFLLCSLRIELQLVYFISSETEQISIHLWTEIDIIQCMRGFCCCSAIQIFIISWKYLKLYSIFGFRRLWMLSSSIWPQKPIARYMSHVTRIFIRYTPSKCMKLKNFRFLKVERVNISNDGVDFSDIVTSLNE